MQQDPQPGPPWPSQAHWDRLPAQVQADIRRRREALAEACGQLPAEALTLEFGCGHGHYLTAYAEAHPGEVCCGIDLVSRRIRKAKDKAHKRGLERLYFLKAEVREFLELLPPDRPLRRIFMLFPDPWPKARHHKNRMIQHALLDDVARRATADARFFFRTDHPGMFDWGREHFATNANWEIAPEEPWPFERTSYFQDLMESWQSLVARRLPG